jgi:hypothetical protein
MQIQPSNTCKRTLAVPSPGGEGQDDGERVRGVSRPKSVMLVTLK